MWDPRMTPEVETIKGYGAPDRAVEEEAPPSVVINPHSDLGKELRKWEQHYGHLTPPGTRPGNPYVFRPYPKMLYMASRQENGQPASVLPNPHPWNYPNALDLERAQLAQENWNRGHQRIVKDEAEERLAKGQGWTETPQSAVDRYEEEQKAVAEAAAQAAFSALRMNEKAKRELAEADASTDAHVVDVKPISGKKRGRKPKSVAVTGTGPIED